MSEPNKRILSGMRPTGALHLGHWLGVLQNWVKFQNDYQCFYMVADWHALMSEYAQSTNIAQSIESVVAEWLACGLDPEQSAIFVQSDVPEHTELHATLSMITPIPWLERCPTFKEQQQELKDKDVFTYAFLGYPVLQTADIVLYKAGVVPVGKDQLPHLELAREIVRRFHHIFQCEIFPEPEPLMTKASKILGLDRRKMSKSYGNTIALGDSPEDIVQKVRTMITDEQRVRLKDPGHPDICNVFSYYELFASEKTPEVRDWCEGAKLGCSQCKSGLADILVETLRPIREKRAELLQNKDYLHSVLKNGADKAREVAQQTMDEVRAVIGLRGGN